MNKIWKILPVIATTGIICPIVTLTSCNNKPQSEQTEYSITYGETPAGFTWTSQPEKISKNVDLTIRFTLATSYSLVQNSCQILVGNKDVKSSCEFSNSYIKIPASVINGDISITMVTTQEIVKCKINYAQSQNITWDSENPSTVNSGDDLSVKYSITGTNNIINAAGCSVKSGSIDITAYASFSGGKVTIPGTYITADLTITLDTKTDTYDSTGVPSTSGVTQYTAAEMVSQTALKVTPYAVAHYIYMDAASATNGTINITLSGNLSDTQILIATKGKYNIILDNATISNSNSNSVNSECPILVDNKNAAVNITIKDLTISAIYDKRTKQTENFFDSDACIKSKGSLTIQGSGTLNINNITSNKGSFSKGIQVTKGNTLTVCETVKLNIFSLGTCLQAAGSIILKDNPTIVADSYYDSGLKTKLEDPEDDAGANLSRDITIQDNVNLTIYAARNGINSGHNFTSTGTPTITIYTSTNAGSNVGSVVQDEQNMFVMFSSSSVSSADFENIFFTCTFADATEDNVKTEIMTLKKVSSGGMGASSGIFYKCDRPLTNQYTKFKIQKFGIDQFPIAHELRSASAVSKWFSISSGSSLKDYDTITASISGSTISSNDKTFSKNYKAAIGQQSSIEKVVGSKGIKADNIINADGGIINITSVDTGLQASYGQIYVTTSNGYVFGAGDVNVAGATINIKSTGGDGAKAYGKATISSGLLNVTQAIEALEGGLISIEGTGIAKLVASDDGVNASAVGKYYPSSSSYMTDLKVSGGVLDVQISKSGDTDAIDSNKGMSITGGLVITRNLSGGGTASAIDTEENVKMTGGTLVAMGNIERWDSTTGIKSGKAPSSPTIYSSGTFTITYDGGTYTFTNNNTMTNNIKIYYQTKQPSFVKN